MRDATGLHKIGVTNCPYTRRRVVTGLVATERRPVLLVRAVQVHAGTEKRLEAEIHDLLWECRVEGEWFRASMRMCNSTLDAVIGIHDWLG